MDNEMVTTQDHDVNLIGNKKQNWITKAFIIGGAIGAVAGLIGAYIFINNHQDGEDEKLNPAIGVQLGLGILGVLRLLTH